MYRHHGEGNIERATVSRRRRREEQRELDFTALAHVTNPAFTLTPGNTVGILTPVGNRTEIDRNSLTIALVFDLSVTRVC